MTGHLHHGLGHDPNTRLLQPKSQDSPPVQNPLGTLMLQHSAQDVSAAAGRAVPLDAGGVLRTR